MAIRSQHVADDRRAEIARRLSMMAHQGGMTASGIALADPRQDL